MLVPMSRIQIVATREMLDKTVRVLHHAGVVQIQERSPAVTPLELDSAAARRREEIPLLLARVDALLALMSVSLSAKTQTHDPPALGVVTRPRRFWVRSPRQARPAARDEIAAQAEAQSARPPDDVLVDVKDALSKVDMVAQDLALLRQELEADRITLPRYAKTMRQLMPLAADLAPFRNYETIALLVDRRSAEAIELIRQELPGVTGDQFELVSSDIDKDTTAALVVFPKQHSAGVQSLLGRKAITRVRLPDELASTPFAQALARIEARLAEIPQEQETVNLRLAALANEWHVILAAWRLVLLEYQEELQVRGRFGATQYTFWIEGWMPSSRVPALQQALETEIGDTLMLTELAPTPDDREHTPVLLANSAPVRPFEFLVKMMALPRYGTIDPTWMMAVFLPLFFGMILGDVGYGVIVLIGALYFQSRPGALGALAAILVYCAVWSILFGLFYGEFFGKLGESLFHMPAYLPRGEAVLALFALSLVFGTVQVGLGLALGIYQAAKLHRTHDLLECVARALAILAAFVILAALMGVVPGAMLGVGLGVLLCAALLLGIPLGWIGVILAPIEILGTFGNILSYLRLGAIGLSSVYLAMVANEMAGVCGIAAVGIVVAVLFHALNIVLGVVSPMIQSLRLHYVEFFGKFYKGGGVGFAPFKSQRLP